jgi:hypothetical protein
VGARPWLSVLIPVYNVLPYLQACLDSVLPQLDMQTEVILVDDCSTDGSDRLAAELAARHAPRVRLLRHERNSGISVTRNTLLDAALGDYLWFLDSDDILMPGAVQALRRSLAEHDPDLVLCDFWDMRDKPKLKHRLRGESHRRTFPGPAGRLITDRDALLAGLFLQGHMHVWNKIARRELWAGLRFPAGRTFEDMALAPTLAMRAQRAVYIDEVWVGYRKRAGSILATQNAQKINDMMLALADLPQQMAGLTPAPSDSTRFLAAHFASKNFVVASRFDARHGDGSRLSTRLEQLQACLVMPADEVARRCHGRGWFWRGLRLAYWLRRSRQVSRKP